MFVLLGTQPGMLLDPNQLDRPEPQGFPQRPNRADLDDRFVNASWRIAKKKPLKSPQSMAELHGHKPS
jgi:hypothetical protein